VVLSGELLDACLADELPRARQLAAFAFPDEDFPRLGGEWIGRRRSQVLADAAWEPWSLRAMVLRNEERMVGFTSFHGPSGHNTTDEAGATEVGYTVFPEFRCRGYATETCWAMLEWARREHGVRLVTALGRLQPAALLRLSVDGGRLGGAASR